MNKKAIFIFFLSFLLLLSFSSIFADERIENIDIYLVLDKSLSMVEEINSVKQYVLENIINKIVIKGDYFLLIPFYGTTDNTFNDYINSNQKLEELQNDVRNLKADGRFTDIGNALDKLEKNIKTTNESSRKYMLLITDGKQEAPKNSPYYSPDGTFNHKFLENTKEIQKKGWKIVVLGIGTNTAAQEIARELSAGYREVPENANSTEIENAVDNLLGTLTVSEIDSIITSRNKYKTNLNFKLESKNYDTVKEITIAEIRLISKGNKEINILNTPFTLSAKPQGITNISIPVELPVLNEDYKGSIVFVFEGRNSFTPAVNAISIEYKASVLLIFLIIISIVVILIIIFYIRRIVLRRKLEDEDSKYEALR